MADFDFLVVGAGSAGCVLASRLARVASVAVIEAGGNTNGGMIRRPGDYVKMFQTADDWSLETTPQVELAGRRLRFPRGKGAGGSTRINASIWLRPLNDCITQLCAATNGSLTNEQLTAAIDNVEQIVKPEAPRWLSDSATHFCSAVQQLSKKTDLPHTSDVSQTPKDRPQARPFLRMNQRAIRKTAADAFLRAAAGNDEPTLIHDCLVDRLEFVSNRAVGVHLCNGKQRRLVTAAKGVLLCAGSVGSPAILQRSGVGCRTRLGPLGIDCRVDLPAVGEEFRDHLIFPVILQTPAAPPFPSYWSPRQLARWRTSGRGIPATNLAEAGLMIGVGEQRIQLHVTPTDYLRHPNLPGVSAMTIGVTKSHPTSKGRIQIISKDPFAAPTIDPAYLSQPNDLRVLENAVQFVRQLAATPPLDHWASCEIVPGKMTTTRSIRRFAQTLYHPVGGCALGPVLTDEFRVKNTERLWVVDASVFPQMPAANPNPLVMGLAWAIADRISQQTLS